jgi:myo-inositol-1(or 4)-monophosphatase
LTADDLELAERAARAAGAVLVERFGGPAEGLGHKTSDTDLVSDADRAAEEVIRDLLEAERPEDGLIAEEGSRQEAESGRRWVVDPLDGTTNFLYGIPQWAVSVALEDADGGLVGVVHDPVHRETFTAVRGEGAKLNGERLEVSACDRLELALVATGFGYEQERRTEQAEVVRLVLPRVRDIRRAGAAALDLAWVAAGRLDAFYERGIKHWDWAAAWLVATEAGVTVADLAGDPPGLIAASSPELFAELEGLVAG